MTTPVDTDRSPLDELKSALSSGDLSKAAQQSGERLLTRLDSPVRVIILGLPQSGKSTVLNMLAGQVVLPNDLSLPTTQLVFGETPRTQYTLSDASTRSFEGIELEAAASLQPALVKLEMPLPQLQKISLLEVVAGGEAVDQERAIRWASKRADMALWCTPQFDDRELDLWANVPEALQDHSFLVLSKADILSEQGTLEERIGALQDPVSEYFHSLVPLAAKQALSAMHANSEEGNALFVSSGGQALITSILRQVRDGRRADMDSVEVFLHRHGLNRQEPSISDNETNAQVEQLAAAPDSGEIETLTPEAEQAQPSQEASKPDVPDHEPAATSTDEPLAEETERAEPEPGRSEQDLEPPVAEPVHEELLDVSASQDAADETLHEQSDSSEGDLLEFELSDAQSPAEQANTDLSEPVPEKSERSKFAAALDLVTSGIEQIEDDHDAFEPDGEATEMPDFDVLELYKSGGGTGVNGPVIDARASAMSYLSERAKDLEKLLANDDQMPTDAVIENCVQTVDHLGDLILNSTGEDAALAGYDIRCQEASELLVLMQLEADSANSLDAVMVVLQLKREFEEREAA